MRAPSRRRRLLPFVLLATLPGGVVAACASDEAARGPPPEEVCAHELTDFNAYVARVAGSRGTWAWPVPASVVMREGDSFPADDGTGRLGISVAAAGFTVFSNSALPEPSTSVADAITQRGAARLAIAFDDDVPLGRVREVLADAQRQGVGELDLVFAQYKPTGPPEPSRARPLVDLLDDCDDCAPLRAQLRVRLAGGCLPLADALWTDEIDDAAPFDARVAAARAWASRVTAGMEECVCAGVDVPALWDVAWQRLKDPQPLTAVAVTFAPPERPASQMGKRRGHAAPAEPPPAVRTISLADDVLWRDAHAAFVEAAPLPVRLR